MITRQDLISGQIKTADYFLVRKAFRPGDPLFFAGEGIISSAIGVFTGSDISHIAAILGQKENGLQRWRLMEASEDSGEGFLGGKVAKQLISEKIKKYDGEVYWSALREGFEIFRPAIKKALKSFEGVPYDYDTLIANIIPGHRDVDYDEMICSEMFECAILRAVPRSFLERYEGNEAVDLMLDDPAQVLVPGEVWELPFFYPPIKLIIEDS